MDKIRCFVSYSHEDVDKEELQCLLDWITSISKDKLKFHFDLDLCCGDDLDDFMKQIMNVDCIFLFLTPSYKNKIEKRIESGVLDEYKFIERVDNANSDLKLLTDKEIVTQRKLICPIIYKGSFKETVPERFKNKAAIILDEFGFVEDKYDDKLKVSNTSAKKYKKSFNKIVSNIITLNEMRQPEYIESYDKLEKDLYVRTYKETQEDQLKEDLLIQTKAEYLNSLPDDIIVKTKAYKNILKQKVYFLIGRKGSGKSTVPYTLKKLNWSKYKGIIGIFAENFDLQVTYDDFTQKRYKNDINNLLSLNQTLQMLWESYILIYSMYTVFKEKKNLSNEQKEHVNSIENWFRKVLDEDVDNIKDEILVSQVFYDHCKSNLFRFIDEVFAKSRNEEKYYRTDIKRNFNIRKFIIFLVGKNVMNDFMEITKMCRRKILISLDGFDSNFEAFRYKTKELYYKNPEERHNRDYFEISWFLALLESTYKYKMNKMHFLKNTIDLCITIPMDRFLEVQQRNRDFYKYRGKLASYNWSGLELAEMIIKRFEVLFDFKTNDSMELKNRFQDIFEHKFKHFPKSIIIDIQDIEHSVPLFQYILRLSFWRPRDVLKYYAKVMALIEDSKTITSEEIKRVIKETSIGIIKDEFILEFKNSYGNILSIVEAFRGANQIIEYDEVYKRINQMSFFNDYIEDDFKIIDKIQILYSMGFFGVIVEPEIMESYNILHKYAFIFNEGQLPFEVFMSNFSRVKLVINCIFTELLALKINSNEIICNYDWPYLEKNHRIMSELNIIPMS